MVVKRAELILGEFQPDGLSRALTMRTQEPASLDNNNEDGVIANDTLLRTNTLYRYKVYFFDCYLV